MWKWRRGAGNRPDFRHWLRLAPKLGSFGNSALQCVKVRPHRNHFPRANGSNRITYVSLIFHPDHDGYEATARSGFAPCGTGRRRPCPELALGFSKGEAEGKRGSGKTGHQVILRLPCLPPAVRGRGARHPKRYFVAAHPMGTETGDIGSGNCGKLLTSDAKFHISSKITNKFCPAWMTRP